MAHLRELALFAGAGGGILGGKLLGWRTVCAVEIEPYCREVLMRRQDEGHLDPFPIWDDVRTFDGTEWRGRVDVVSGGFPCQDVSIAAGGTRREKAKGIDGERSGLWWEMARIVGEVQPRHVFVENSPMLLTRGADRVVGRLAELGYDCRWGVVGARALGAPHARDRLWIYCHSNQNREPIGTLNDEAQGLSPDAANAVRNSDWPLRGAVGRAGRVVESVPWDRIWEVENQPGFVGVDDGLANHMDRIGAIGNGQVPAVAAAAWRILGGP